MKHYSILILSLPALHALYLDIYLLINWFELQVNKHEPFHTVTSDRKM